MPAPVPNTGTTARVLGASSGLEGVRAASSEGPNDPARTGASSVIFAVASRVSSWLGGSEDAVAAVTSPAAISSMAGEGVAASAEVVSLACVGPAAVAVAGPETAFAGTSGRTGSSALASLATNSNRGEWRSLMAGL
jgi:hypothetical protein